MVNQTVLEYLRKYGAVYKLEDLKQKIISSGYLEQDFNEAAALLGLEKQKEKISALPKVAETGKKGKLMKFSGIIGIIFLVLSAILLVLYFFVPLDSLQTDNIGVTIMILAFAILIFVMGLIFLAGFARMGKYTSKLLRFSAVALMIVSILVVIISIASTVLVYSWVKSFINTRFTGAAIYSLAEQSSGTDLLSGFNSLGALGWAIFVTILLLFLFLFIITILFFTGLIISGKKVRFAKLAGVFGILLIVVSIVFSLYFYINPFVMSSLIISGTAGTFILIILIAIYLLSLLTLLFETLCLFDASKKFEQQEAQVY